MDLESFFHPKEGVLLCFCRQSWALRVEVRPRLVTRGQENAEKKTLKPAWSQKPGVRAAKERLCSARQLLVRSPCPWVLPELC